MAEPHGANTHVHHSIAIASPVSLFHITGSLSAAIVAQDTSVSMEPMEDTYLSGGLVAQGEVHQVKAGLISPMLFLHTTRRARRSSVHFSSSSSFKWDADVMATWSANGFTPLTSPVRIQSGMYRYLSNVFELTPDAERAVRFASASDGVVLSHHFLSFADSRWRAWTVSEAQRRVLEGSEGGSGFANCDVVVVSLGGCRLVLWTRCPVEKASY